MADEIKKRPNLFRLAACSLAFSLKSRVVMKIGVVGRKILGNFHLQQLRTGTPISLIADAEDAATSSMSAGVAGPGPRNGATPGKRTRLGKDTLEKFCGKSRPHDKNSHEQRGGGTKPPREFSCCVPASSQARASYSGQRIISRHVGNDRV